MSLCSIPRGTRALCSQVKPLLTPTKGKGAEERAPSSQVKGSAQHCRINPLTNLLCRLEKPPAPASPMSGPVLQTLCLWGCQAQESTFPIFNFSDVLVSCITAAFIHL